MRENIKKYFQLASGVAVNWYLTDRLASLAAMGAVIAVVAVIILNPHKFGLILFAMSMVYLSAYWTYQVQKVFYREDYKNLPDEHKHSARIARAILFLGLCVLVMGIVGCSPAQASEDIVPDLGWKKRMVVKKELRRAWGLWGSNYVSVIGSQIHQESLWKPDAKSWVGAECLAQFMPQTAKFMEEIYPHLKPFDPCNPNQAIAGMVLYDKWLYDRIRSMNGGIPECDHYAMALSRYNGGGIKADRLRAATAGYDPDRWFGHTENHNGRKREDWAFKENRGYPRRILLTLVPAYLRAGYGGVDICEGVT